MTDSSEAFDFFAFFGALMDAPKSKRFSDYGLDTLGMMVALAIARNHESGRKIDWWFVPIELEEEYAYNDSGKKRRTLTDQTGMARTTITRRIERLLELNIICRKSGRTSYAYQPVLPDEWDSTVRSARLTRSLRSVDPVALNGQPERSDARNTPLIQLENATRITEQAPASLTQWERDKAFEEAENWIQHLIRRGDTISNPERLSAVVVDCYLGHCFEDHQSELHGKPALFFHRSLIADEEQKARAATAQARGQSDLRSETA